MQKRIVYAKAPLRIGLAGGGTDVDPYAAMKGGIVFNTTIDKYAYCTLVPNGGKTMAIKSVDYGTYEMPLDGGPLPYDGKMDLIKAVTNHFSIRDGFDMFIRSDAPPGSGLGGSSTVIVSMISAVAEWQGLKMSKQDMAGLAYRLEREEIGLKGGKQDQYAAVFGGFNLMRFGGDGVKVRAGKIKKSVAEELQRRSVLCYTGCSRESADVISSQVRNLESGVNEDAFDASKKLALEMFSALRKGRIEDTGELLHESWEQKKRFSSKVATPLINRMYAAAAEAGAIGGKISGAGGGGFMYFVCEDGRAGEVAGRLKALGARITDFAFEDRGASSGGVKFEGAADDGSPFKFRKYRSVGSI